MKGKNRLVTFDGNRNGLCNVSNEDNPQHHEPFVSVKSRTFLFKSSQLFTIVEVVIIKRAAPPNQWISIFQENSYVKCLALAETSLSKQTKNSNLIFTQEIFLMS